LASTNACIHLDESHFDLSQEKAANLTQTDWLYCSNISAVVPKEHRCTLKKHNGFSYLKTSIDAAFQRRSLNVC